MQLLNVRRIPFVEIVMTSSFYFVIMQKSSATDVNNSAQSHSSRLLTSFIKKSLSSVSNFVFSSLIHNEFKR